MTPPYQEITNNQHVEICNVKTKNWQLNIASKSALYEGTAKKNIISKA